MNHAHVFAVNLRYLPDDDSSPLDRNAKNDRGKDQWTYIYFFALVRRLSNSVFEMSQNTIPDFGYDAQPDHIQSHRLVSQSPFPDSHCCYLALYGEPSIERSLRAFPVMGFLNPGNAHSRILLILASFI
jgi:hypothetical protein